MHTFELVIRDKGDSKLRIIQDVNYDPPRCFYALHYWLYRRTQRHFLYEVIIVKTEIKTYTLFVWNRYVISSLLYLDLIMTSGTLIKWLTRQSDVRLCQNTLKCRESAQNYKKYNNRRTSHNWSNVLNRWSVDDCAQQ